MKRFIFWFALGAIHGSLCYLATINLPSIPSYKICVAFTMILVAESIFFEKIFKSKIVRKTKYSPKHQMEQSRKIASFSNYVNHNEKF